MRNVLGQQAPPQAPTDEFSKLVEECRTTKSPRIIENTSMAHAAILLKNLLILAKDQKSDVQLVSGRLEPAVYNDLTSDVGAALNAGCKVEIIALCEKDQLDDNLFYQAVVAHPRGEVIAMPDSADQLHFLVTDSAYRVEVDDSVKKAYASFNDRGGVMTEVLKERFSELWNSREGGRSGGERNVSRPVGAN